MIKFTFADLTQKPILTKTVSSNPEIKIKDGITLGGVCSNKIEDSKDICGQYNTISIGYIGQGDQNNQQLLRSKEDIKRIAYFRLSQMKAKGQKQCKNCDKRFRFSDFRQIILKNCVYQFQTMEKQHINEIKGKTPLGEDYLDFCLHYSSNPHEIHGLVGNVIPHLKNTPPYHFNHFFDDDTIPT